ncbi:MAG TPA: hypothetical protein PKA13_03810 [Geminicoccaceae bacterium]|nr:hypothetical protein [Geminicoccus sp.]HMU48874.1 hypothetical protein [Geminicoccaceae bacterium]
MLFGVLERFEPVWPIAQLDRTCDATLVPEAPPRADASGFRPSIHRRVGLSSAELAHAASRAGSDGDRGG